MRRFGRGFAIFLVGGLFGTVFGIALGFFFFPYVFPPPPAAEQLTQADLMPPPVAEQSAQPPAASSPQVASPAPGPSVPAAQSPPAQVVAVPVATGSFIHANKSDPVHWGKGKVSVYQRAVFL